MQTIYEPKGKAKEYCDWAMNIFTECNHRCSYCYCPLFLHKKPEDFFKDDFTARPGLIPALEKELATGKHAGKLIHLVFVGDPYPAPPVNTTVTREVIRMLKGAGCHVQILTKGGARAERDFDLLDSEDWFGVTYSGMASQEPGAAPVLERLSSLSTAHDMGIKTWISCEPVLNASNVLELMCGASAYLANSLFRIGKLNYHPSPINWGEFGRECERLAALYGRNIYIKAELRAEMEAHP